MKFSRDLVSNIDDIGTRRRESFPEIEDERFWSMYDVCKDFSLLHVAGFYNLYSSLKYIHENRIAGSAVEAGCFLGGAAALMGLMRNAYGADDSEIILFDTFEGPPVGSTDIITGGGVIETPWKLPNYQKQVQETLMEVVGSLGGYRLIIGLVEDTIPTTKTGPISLLRLDTDFYSSTSIELDYLYPRLSAGGVLIIDDYGWFKGARKATDEYFARSRYPPLLNRIDAGIWAGVKPEGSDKSSFSYPTIYNFLSRLGARNKNK